MHPPCKATWSTPTNYITYGDKLGILLALTGVTDTTALDIAAGAGGSRLKGRMEDLLHRWKYVLFFIEVPKTEDEDSTYNVMYLSNQYELLLAFNAEYEWAGTNATSSEMPDRRHVIVVPRFTALKIAEKHRASAKAFATPKPAKILSYTENDAERKLWLQDAPVDPLTLREHCDIIRQKEFCPKVWQVPLMDSPVEALKSTVPKNG